MTYHYDYRNGRVTLNWLEPNGKNWPRPALVLWLAYCLLRKFGIAWYVGLVRIHDDPEHVPGPYERTVVVFVIGKTYELMGLRRPLPTKEEFKHFYAYLDSLGLKRFYRRAKKGQKVYEIAQ
jgi:hypothetical protein